MAADDVPNRRDPSNRDGGDAREGRAEGSQPPRGTGDETVAFDPLADTSEAGTAGPADTAGPAGTQILPPLRDSEPQSGHPESTKPTTPGAPEPPAPPKWSARAQVPSRQYDEQAVEWTEVDQPRRRVLVPVLIVLCILLIAALIGLGLWLALREPPEPEPVPPPVPTTTTSPPAPTTQAPPPTTEAPAPTTSAPLFVPVPRVAGLPLDQAIVVLNEAGFNVVESPIFQPSEEFPAGTVIGTLPAEGEQRLVPANVTVIVSSGPPSPASPSPTPTE